jgi:hypothetical protein
MMNDKDRYLITGTGRSGSSLLAAILADAGANFGIPAQTSWDRRGGAYEHKKLHLAYNWYSRAQKISRSLWPGRMGRKYCERQMREELRSLLTDVPYAKSQTLVWLVHEIRALGFRPRIIVSYREFNGYAASFHIRLGMRMSELAETYVDTYATTALQLQLFGGCAVSYEELMDEREEAWATAVSQLTGLPAEKLLEARQKRAERGQPPKASPILDPGVVDSRIPAMYQAFAALKGKVIEPA